MNTKTKWTAEPWDICKGTNGFCDTWQVHIETPHKAKTIADCGAIENTVYSQTTESVPVKIKNEENEANAKRIVECVNACSNLASPGEAILEMTNGIGLLLKLVNSRLGSREYEQAIKDARWILAKLGYSIHLEG